MAKSRMVNTKFWTDDYVLEHMNPIDKLFYLYLLTNPYTEIIGIYELSLKIAAFETGIHEEIIRNEIVPRLHEDGKVMYENGWIAIRNFAKYQQTNPSILKGVSANLHRLPPKLLQYIKDSVGTDCIHAGGTSLYSIILNYNSIQSDSINNISSPAADTNPTQPLETSKDPEPPAKKKRAKRKKVPTGIPLTDIREVVTHFMGVKRYNFAETPEGQKKLQDAWSRFGAVATRILQAGYSAEEAKRGVDYCNSNFKGEIQWTLETVEKRMVDAVQTV